MMKISLLTTAILILLVELAWSSETQLKIPQKIPQCGHSFNHHWKASIGSLIADPQSLPKSLLLAKSAKYLVQGKGKSFKIIAEQSFVKGKAQIVCASGTSDISQSFSIYAPALLDLTDSKEIGHSFWQFHISVSDKKLGVWNQKTRMFKNIEDLEKTLSSLGFDYQWSQISYDEFELILNKESSGYLERLSLKFDLVKPQTKAK